MIYGLTDQAPKLPSGGVLKKGEAKLEKRPGRDLDEQFRFVGKGTPLQQRLIERAFKQHYPEPTVINCWLVHPIASDNFHAEMAVYGSGNWKKQECNLKDITRWYDGTCYREEPKPCQFDRASQKCPLGCGRTGYLSIWIPELFRDRFVKPITVLTHSKNDIAHLSESLAYWSTLTDDIRGVPFVLKREAEAIFRPGFDKAGNRTDKRGKDESWLLSLNPPPGWLEQRLREIGEDTLRPTPQVEPVADKAPVIGREETDAETRLGALVQITGCPWRTIQGLARSLYSKSVAQLSEPECRRVRSEVFLQWAEMQYGLERSQCAKLLKQFWGKERTEADDVLFQAWQGWMQRWSIDARIDRSR